MPKERNFFNQARRLQIAPYQPRDAFDMLGQDGMLLSLSPGLQTNRKAGLSAIEQNARAYQYISRELRTDPTFFRDAIKCNAAVFQFASEALKKDSDFVLTTLKHNFDRDAEGEKSASPMFEHILPELKHNRDFVLRAVSLDPFILPYTPFQDDREIVLAAMNIDTCVLQYVSPRLKGDLEILLIAVNRWANLLEEASDALRNNEALVLAALNNEQERSALEGEVFQYASPELKNNAAFALDAIRRNVNVFKHASQDLRNNPTFILTTLTNISDDSTDEEEDDDEYDADNLGRLIFDHISPELKANRHFMLDAVCQNAYSFKHAAQNLRDDPTFWREAFQRISAVNPNISAAEPEALELTRPGM